MPPSIHAKIHAIELAKSPRLRVSGTGVRTAMAIGLVLGLMLKSSTTSASPLSPTPCPERFAAWVGLAYFTDSQRASALHVVSHNLGAAYARDAHWAFSLEWGLTGLHSTSDAAPSETVVVIGNPTGFGWYNFHLGRTRLRFGAGATFPAATVDDGGGGRLERSAYTHANAMDGLSRPWLWAPSRTSLLLRGESIAPLASWLTLKAALTPVILVPAWADFPNDSIEFVMPAQLGLVAAYHGVELGSRIQAVWMPSSTLDALQLSVEPGAGLSIGNVRMSVYATINLDEPLAGERGAGIWGLHGALEVRL